MAHLQNDYFRVSISMAYYANVLYVATVSFFIIGALGLVLDGFNLWWLTIIMYAVLSLFCDKIINAAYNRALDFEEDKKNQKQEIEWRKAVISNMLASIPLSDEELLANIDVVIVSMFGIFRSVKDYSLFADKLRHDINFWSIELRAEVIEVEISLKRLQKQKPWGYEWWERYMLKSDRPKSYGRNMS